MNFKKEILTTQDCLKTVRFISSNLFQGRLARIIMTITFILYLACILLHICYFLREFDLKFVVKHIPMLSWSIFGNLAIFILLWKPTLVCELEHEFELWAEDSIGVMHAKKIRRESFIISLFVVVNSMLSLCTTIPHWSLDKDIEYDIYLLPKFLKEFYIFGISETIYFVLKVSLLPFIFVMGVHSYQVIYYTQHMKFQIYLLRNYIQNLTENFQHNDLQLIFSTEYQLEIKKRLIFCFIRHIQLNKAGAKKNKEIKLLIVAFSLAGCFHGIGCVIYIYLNYVHGLFLNGILPMILFITTFSSLIMAGQAFQTESERLADAISHIAWYTFNTENRQNLLIILPTLGRVQKFKFTENIAINNALGVAIVKSIFSVISVILQIRLRKN